MKLLCRQSFSMKFFFLFLYYFFQWTFSNALALFLAHTDITRNCMKMLTIYDCELKTYRRNKLNEWEKKEIERVKPLFVGCEWKCERKINISKSLKQVQFHHSYNPNQYKWMGNNNKLLLLLLLLFPNAREREREKPLQLFELNQEHIGAILIGNIR